MGLIHIELFATLDLVGQSPGGPDEDPAGFPFGGWQAPLWDEVTDTQVGAAYDGTDALLLGRRTYDIFAGYWPHQEGGDDNVKVVGSLNLVQTLLRERLFDRLDLWIHPVVLGVGKKVFDDGAVPTNLTLLEPPEAGRTGTVYLRYGLADGMPETGDMSAAGRAAASGE